MLGRGGSSLFVLLALVSCGPRGGTDVGNGATVSFDLAGYQTMPSSAATKPKKNSTLSAATGDTIDEVWVAVDRFDLMPCAAASDAVRYDQPIIVNLLDPDANMADAIGLTPTTYCRLRLSLHEVAASELPAGAPTDLADASLLMRGHRADGVPYVVRSRGHLLLRLDATKEGGFVLIGDNPLIVGFDLGAMIAALDLSTLDAAPIMIDADHEPARLKALDKALRKSAALFRDSDGDGLLSPDESTEDVLAEGAE